jgi:hypothetical protein
VSLEIRELISQMSTANPLWGAPRIHGELLKLGIRISQATVAKYMVHKGKPPSQTWRTFLENHVQQLVAIDFLIVPTVSFRLLYVFVVVAHQRSYNRLADEYTHNVINHAEKYVDGQIHTNGIENFWSLLKRTIKGTYVSVEPFHLFRYLDEQSFRFNKRKGTDGQRFQMVTEQVTGKRVTYAELTGKSKEEDRQAN